MKIKEQTKEKMKKIFETLKKNNIPSGKYFVSGSIERNPIIDFSVNNKDKEKLLKIFPFVKISHEFETISSFYIKYENFDLI